MIFQGCTQNEFKLKSLLLKDHNLSYYSQMYNLMKVIKLLVETRVWHILYLHLQSRQWLKDRRVVLNCKCKEAFTSE